MLDYGRISNFWEGKIPKLSPDGSRGDSVEQYNLTKHKQILPLFKSILFIPYVRDVVLSIPVNQIKK